MPLGGVISNKALMDIYDATVAVHRPTTVRFFIDLLLPNGSIV